MFIKLTNVSGDYRGEPLYVNIDHITCVYEHSKVPDGSLSSFVYGGLGGVITWEVEESTAQILKLIEDARNAKGKSCSCK